MTLDWTTDSDEDDTIYLRIHPKDQRERERIVDVLDTLIGTEEPGYATIYGETLRDIHGVTEHPDGLVLSDLKGNEHPDLEIRVWRER